MTPRVMRASAVRMGARSVPSKAVLDRSAAMEAARVVIAGWDAPPDDDRVAHLRAVARAEFGRRGFEITTMRDVAKAAGMSTGTVYRMFGSKDDLLVDIMAAYSENVAAACRPCNLRKRGRTPGAGGPGPRAGRVRRISAGWRVCLARPCRTGGSAAGTLRP